MSYYPPAIPPPHVGYTHPPPIHHDRPPVYGYSGGGMTACERCYLYGDEVACSLCGGMSLIRSIFVPRRRGFYRRGWW